MDDFLIKFFPRVHERKLHAKENNYCKYDDQLLQLFTSSLYLAALVSSFFASKACTVFGRKPTIMLASIFFLAGAGISAGAEHNWMLILGRLLFGMGVGFGNEVSSN
ncbi:unnamed protein product [Thlaspi arvense]|uniref:Major facilitator superfamily (MFS) profile domain-containing protein n=1 Tax=Thlaspi arvense TaxID=13288 RepID=A0AAU9S2L3_THLAR|nr:unnamed protein product [Thlaspi arvense]